MGRTEDCLYLVRRFVPGASLQARLRRGPLELADALTVGRCLLSALRRCMAAASCTATFAPPTSSSATKCRWPARSWWTATWCGITQFDASADERSVETARYRSPEQTGSLDYEVAEAADLYSAGVVLFECLAGRPPFEGDSVGGILLQHMTARAPELRSLGLGIPRALDEVIQRLLRKDPRDRYQSAEAVLMDLADIAAALSEGRFEPQGVIGSRDRRPTLTESAFVGRQREIEQLDEQVAQARAGRGSLVLVESESGGGKTRLLTELALPLPQQGMMVFRGQGSEQVGRHPFQVLNGIISQLSIAARSQSRPGRRGEPPPGRPSRCRHRRRSRTGRRPGLADLEPAGTGSLRRSPQHRGPLRTSSTPWVRRSSRPWSSWTTASGPTS